MLNIETPKAEYTLIFHDENDRAVHSYNDTDTLEGVLYGACTEWCENFKYVEVFDDDRLACIMHDDGGIQLFTASLWATLD